MAAPDPSALIVHQYDVSPFSEKVRIVLGVKGLAWRACNQPNMMPKDDLLALTGGYRRIPVLQIGADLYFDSLHIIEVLERRHPTPPVFTASQPASTIGLGSLSEEAFFRTAVALLFAHDWDATPAFMADRSALMGAPFDADAMAALRPAQEAKMHGNLATLDGQLADGRAYLTGPQPDVVDAAFYCHLHMVRAGKGRTAALLDEHPHLLAWEQRVKGLGQGRRSEISRTDAIAIARAAVPQPLADTSSPGPDDPQVGQRVRVKYRDANSPVLEGTLAGIRAHSFSVRRESDAAGTLMLHMPRCTGTLSAA
ncbi:MAG: glutathione S-transferase family protein [Burkholderiales bacterium]